MPTGPDHYREAEKLLKRAHRVTAEGNNTAGLAFATEAVGHALLAGAAATAMSASVDGDPDTGMPPRDAEAWFAACGTRSQASTEA